MFLGIEIGGTKLQLVLGQAGVISRRWRAMVDRAKGGPGICQQIQLAIAELRATPEGRDLRAAGVGFGGPIDTRTGRVCTSHQIDGWENFPLRQWLNDELKLPAAVDNDANVASFGEARRGAGKGLDPVFFCTLGSGVGGGIVADGKIYHGLPPGEVEFGHLLLDRAGVNVESRCSGWAIDRRIRALRETNPSSLLAKSLPEKTGGEAKLLLGAIAQGDPAALALMDELTSDLAFALSHVTHLFHPQMLILGGGLSLMGETLRGAVAAKLPSYVMKAFLPAPIVAVPGLGEDSVPIGALELAADAVG